MSKKNNINKFENDLVRLEEIAGLLERDDIGLEEAITLYEEGILLSKSCIDTLKNAELKITELKSKINKDSKISSEPDEENNNGELF